MKFMRTLSAVTVAALFGAAHVSAQTPDLSEDLEPLPNFISFSGKIKEIQKPAAENAGYTEVLLTENAEGGQTAFRITGDTCFVTDKKADIGAEIIGFYDGGAPMTMQYPPSPMAKVIAVGLEKDKFIKVDRFNKELISEDGQLKLNIGPDTKTTLQNSEAFDGELASRTLVVIYSGATRSIPAQTTPEKIVVLYEKAVPPIYTLTDEEKAALNSGNGTAKPAAPGYELTEEDKAMLAKGSRNLTISVNNVTVDGPKPYINEDGVFMLPVRAVAEAMGLNVEWSGGANTVQVGKSASFAIGRDAYAKNKMAPVELGTAPVLKGGVTYVPLDFFTKIIEYVTVNYTPDSIGFHISVNE
ncbi:MAG: copper amine oxidase N-terminal domain-containing protein [Clostridiales bacterium]|jgi:hypothetical protein|nr:copper amine oxidase N-terminal domain-containing protein [Clostridiales bacterium]